MSCFITIALLGQVAVADPQTFSDTYYQTEEPCPAVAMPRIEQPGALGIAVPPPPTLLPLELPSHPENGPSGSYCLAHPTEGKCKNG